MHTNLKEITIRLRIFSPSEISSKKHLYYCETVAMDYYQNIKNNELSKRSKKQKKNPEMLEITIQHISGLHSYFLKHNCQNQHFAKQFLTIK